MKKKEYRFYMQTAVNAAQMSHAVRKKVGACVVSKNRGVYIGYNGTPEGHDNCCECVDDEGNLVTKAGVIHAEQNALAKMLKDGVSAEGCHVFITLSPCAFCSSMMIAAGVKKVTYLEEYRITDGLELLEKSNVEVEKYEEEI